MPSRKSYLFASAGVATLGVVTVLMGTNRHGRPLIWTQIPATPLSQGKHCRRKSISMPATMS